MSKVRLHCILILLFALAGESCVMAADAAPAHDPFLIIQSIHLKLIGDGKENASLTRFIQNFPLKTGQRFASTPYEQTKSDWLQAAYNIGYVKAYFKTHEVRANYKTHRADIWLTLDTSDPFYIGNIQYQNSKLPSSFLNSLFRNLSQERYSPKALYEMQDSLINSGYFKSASVTPDLNHIDHHHVPVTIDLIDSAKERYDIGLGYGSFTGPRISTGMKFTRLMNTAQQVAFIVKHSSVTTNASLDYIIPGYDPLTQQYIAHANYQRLTAKNGESESTQIAFSKVKKTQDWQRRISLHYLIERYQIEEENPQKNAFFYPSVQWRYVKTNDLVNPSQGKLLQLTLQGSHHTLLASSNFVQMNLNSKYLFSPTPSTQLLWHGEFGYTFVHDLTELPLTLRFLTGGIDSIRAYPDNSIGPGKYLLVGGMEVRQQFYGDWYGAVFVDTGTASDHIGKPPLQFSDGVGIVYRSVLGPIRLYLGRAESKPNKPFGVEFTIGPEF